MRKYPSLQYLLLGIWLIATGAAALLGIAFPLLGLALDILAIATGIVILIHLGGGGWPERLGMICLAVWLILVGLMPWIGMSLPFLSEIAMILAIAAGIFILIALKRGRTVAWWGMLLLGIWLIASAVIPLLDISFPAEGIILALMEVVSGILILIRI